MSERDLTRALLEATQADQVSVPRVWLEALLSDESFWEAELSIDEAAAWGGYSTSQLRRLISNGTLPVTKERRIKRRHVPAQPGRDLRTGAPLTPLPGTPVSHMLRRA